MGTHRVSCPVCGRTEDHEDDRHWFTDDGSHAYTHAKPPYRIDGMIGMRIAPGTIKAEMIDSSGFDTWAKQQADAYWEQQRRAVFRQIADAQAVRGEWHEGTCTGCGMDDLPVIGLPGSEFCRYCEELRQNTPVENKLEPATTPAAPARTVNSRRLTASVLCAIAGMLLGFTDIWIGIPVALMLTSFVLSKTA